MTGRDEYAAGAEARREAAAGHGTATGAQMLERFVRGYVQSELAARRRRGDAECGRDVSAGPDPDPRS